jgi:hypothetical protein
VWYRSLYFSADEKPAKDKPAKTPKKSLARAD